MAQKVDFLRASGWISPAALRDKTLHIAGCGAIGSHVALFAAKMGWTNFDLWDADLVESHNLPNQTFGLGDIGKPKVEALAKVLTDFNPEIKVTIHKEFLTKEHKDLIRGPFIIATDSMKSRSEFTEIFQYNTNIPWVLEARLGFDYGEIHVIKPLDFKYINAWNDSLKDDSEVPEGPCNLRICTTLVAAVSATLVHYLCEPYAERRGAAEWEPVWLTRYMLKNQLTVRTHKL
jgi:sulfur carrier protein ThiS adenylyltransferase